MRRRPTATSTTPCSIGWLAGLLFICLVFRLLKNEVMGVFFILGFKIVKWLGWLGGDFWLQKGELLDFNELEAQQRVCVFFGVREAGGCFGFTRFWRLSSPSEKNNRHMLLQEECSHLLKESSFLRLKNRKCADNLWRLLSKDRKVANYRAVLSSILLIDVAYCLVPFLGIQLFVQFIGMWKASSK